MKHKNDFPFNTDLWINEMNIKEEKDRFRQEIKSKIKGLSLTERDAKSTAIAEKIRQSRIFKEANVIMFYAAMTYEVDTTNIIETALNDSKRVVLPLMKEDSRDLLACGIKDLKRDTKECRYGFREPKLPDAEIIDKEKIDVVYIPGVCFSRKNERLGRGAGYYDRFLSELNPETIKIGLAFDFQLVDTIPTEKHDVPLDGVITDKYSTI